MDDSIEKLERFRVVTIAECSNCNKEVIDYKVDSNTIEMFVTLRIDFGDNGIHKCSDTDYGFLKLIGYRKIRV